MLEKIFYDCVSVFLFIGCCYLAREAYMYFKVFLEERREIKKLDSEIAAIDRQIRFHQIMKDSYLNPETW